MDTAGILQLYWSRDTEMIHLQSTQQTYFLSIMSAMLSIMSALNVCVNHTFIESI